MDECGFYQENYRSFTAGLPEGRTIYCGHDSQRSTTDAPGVSPRRRGRMRTVCVPLVRSVCCTHNESDQIDPCGWKHAAVHIDLLHLTVGASCAGLVHCTLGLARHRAWDMVGSSILKRVERAMM